MLVIRMDQRLRKSYKELNNTENEISAKVYDTISNINMNIEEEELTPEEANKIPPIPSAASAVVKTNLGDITIEFFGADAPKTVENFIKLANEGFYNDTKFHRVISGFMIQGGDPLSKNDVDRARWGTGGPGYQFEDELNSSTKSYQVGYQRGVLAMANAGPNTNGSQFFIMHKDYGLPHNYTIFGKAISGIEVVDAIAAVATDSNDGPLTPVVIEQIIITRQ